MKRVLSILSALFLTAGAFAQTEANMIDAAQLYADGKIEAALSAFERIHAKDSTNDAACYYLGLCEYYTGKLALAEKHFSAAVALDSTNNWYMNTLASFYDSQGRNLEAARLCEILVEREPQFYRSPYTLTMIGDAKYANRQDSLALEYYQKALDIDETYAPAEISKAEVLRVQQNYPGYFLSLGKFIENRQLNGALKSNYLRTLLGNIDARFYWVWGEQIGKLVDRCLELHPDDMQSLVNKLNICFIKNDTTAWMGVCEKIIPLARAQKDTANLIMAMSVMGDTYHSLGNAKKAYATYEEALKVDPDAVGILNNYAYFLCEEGRRLKKAEKMARRVIELEPDNATYLDTYGWILYLLKKPKEAKPHFKRAMIYGGKESDVILEHYATVLEALGEKDLAAYYSSLAEQKKKK